MGWGWGVHCIGSRKVTALNRHISVIVSTLTSWFRKSTYLISILSSLKRKFMAKFSSSKRCLQDLVCWTRKCNRECTMSMHFSKPQPKGRTRFIVNNFFLLTCLNYWIQSILLAPSWRFLCLSILPPTSFFFGRMLLKEAIFCFHQVFWPPFPSSVEHHGPPVLRKCHLSYGLSVCVAFRLAFYYRILFLTVLWLYSKV